MEEEERGAKNYNLFCKPRHFLCETRNMNLEPPNIKIKEPCTFMCLVRSEEYRNCQLNAKICYFWGWVFHFFMNKIFKNTTHYFVCTKPSDVTWNPVEKGINKKFIFNYCTVSFQLYYFFFLFEKNICSSSPSSLYSWLINYHFFSTLDSNCE